jgi:hypothetical protein
MILHGDMRAVGEQNSFLAVFKLQCCVNRPESRFIPFDAARATLQSSTLLRGDFGEPGAPFKPGFGLSGDFRLKTITKSEHPGEADQLWKSGASAPRHAGINENGP